METNNKPAEQAGVNQTSWPYPRRSRLDLLTNGETVIKQAIGHVETMGAHPRLTKVVTMLGDAFNLLADHVDRLPYEETDTPTVGYWKVENDPLITMNPIGFIPSNTAIVTSTHAASYVPTGEEKLNELKDEVRKRLVKEDIRQLDMLATGHNLVKAIQSQSWDRIPKKLHEFINSYNNAVDDLNAKTDINAIVESIPAPTFKDRLVNEQLDLQVKIEKLMHFVDSDKADNIEAVQLSMLYVQLMAMQTYNQALKERLKWLQFKPEESSKLIMGGK